MFTFQIGVVVFCMNLGFKARETTHFVLLGCSEDWQLRSQNPVTIKLNYWDVFSGLQFEFKKISILHENFAALVTSLGKLIATTTTLLLNQIDSCAMKTFNIKHW